MFNILTYIVNKTHHKELKHCSWMLNDLSSSYIPV